METNDLTSTNRTRRQGRNFALLTGVLLVLLFSGHWFWRKVAFTQLREPLIEAVRLGNVGRVQTLLEQGADANVRVHYRSEPLSWRSLFRSLHGKKPVEEENTYSNTVLVEAISKKRADIVHLLLSHGASPRTQVYFGRPLDWAIGYGSIECMQTLIDHGADMNEKNTYGFSPLFSAASAGYNDVGRITPAMSRRCAAFLLQHGAKVDIRNQDGATPFNAAAYGSPWLLDLYLQYGADVNARDKDGCTPLIVAGDGINNETTQFLVKHGAQIDARDNQNKTALMHVLESARDQEMYRFSTRAFKARYQAVVRTLLAAGADARLKDKNSQSVLQKAHTLTEEHVTVGLIRRALARSVAHQNAFHPSG